MDDYKIIDLNTYYRRDTYRHFTKDCKTSVSITSKIDVTSLYEYSKKTNTKFYINFLYLLSRVLNSREDYRLDYSYKKDELHCYNVINPKHYIFHDDTETITVVYSKYYSDYKKFYEACAKDIEDAKNTRDYNFDDNGHEGLYFDASFIPWVSYESLHIELPDGYLYYPPIVNFGSYKQENDKLLIPVTVRLNHAVADGYLVALVFRLLEKEIKIFVESKIRTKEE